MTRSVFCKLARVCAVVGTIACLAGNSFGQLIHQESFEGNDSGYSFDEESYAPVGSGDWAPGVWGLNTSADQIGLQQNAPARRAAILWDNDPADDGGGSGDLFADEAYATWVPLVDWAAGVANAAARKDARVGFFNDFLNESVEGIKDSLVAAGYTESNMLEIFDVADVVPADMEVVIQSATSTAFSAVKVPLISFSGADHDDTAIAGIGQRIAYDQVTLEVPAGVRNHPALGGLGATGTIPWTTGDFVNLQNIGKTHNGGTTLALAENPNTGELSAAIFVIEEGAPLLGAFNPAPEGRHYFVASALNKHGPGLEFGEAVLELAPINVSGFADVQMTVKLAATAADFENGDYLRIEVSADGNDFDILDEFYGVDEAHDAANLSGCLKGLSNGDEPGAVGDICLPTEQFEDFNYSLPSGASTLTVRFSLLNTWGNEIVGIDDIRIHSGPLGNIVTAPLLQAGDADQDLDFDQLDLVKVQIAAKYLSGQPATWGDGDWNGAPGGKQGDPPAGDGQFNQLDIIAALGNALYLQGPYAAIAAGGAAGDGQTSIVYNAATGEVSVDAPAGTNLTSINIDSAGGIFTGAAAQNLGGSFDNDADANIFKATFGGSFGSLSFGSVASAGLSADFLLSDLTVVGSLAGGGALGNVDLIYVPEPGTALLLLISVLAVFPVLRRKGLLCKA